MRFLLAPHLYYIFFSEHTEKANNKEFAAKGSGQPSIIYIKEIVE